MSETNQERAIRKLQEEVYGLTKVLRKLTGVIEKAMEPEPAPKEPPAIPRAEVVNVQEGVDIALISGQEPLVRMTAPAAVATLRSICKDAASCERDGCPIYDWCQENFRDATAPAYWPDL